MTDIERPTPRSGSISFLLQRQFGILRPEPPEVDPNPGARLTRLTRPALRDALPSSTAQVAQARAKYESMSDAELADLVTKARLEDEEKAAAKRVEEDRALFFNQPRASADFSFWGKMAQWTLDEAVALSLGKNPGRVNWEKIKGDDSTHVSAAFLRSPFPGEYARRRELSKRAFKVHELGDPVRPEKFLLWALRVFDSVPNELVEQVRSMGTYIADLKTLEARVADLEAQLSQREAIPQSKWPWGRRETKWLALLAQAAEKFWQLYDPSDPTTAPTNDQVSEWLVSQGASQNIAQAMATILRAEGIAAGPRK